MPFHWEECYFPFWLLLSFGCWPFYEVQVARRPCSFSAGNVAIFCQNPLQLPICSCATQLPQVFAHTMFNLQSLLVNIVLYLPVWTAANLVSPRLFDALVGAELGLQGSVVVFNLPTSCCCVCS